MVRDGSGFMARFDDVICYYFVQDADGRGKWWTGVAEGDEEGFYCLTVKLELRGSRSPRNAGKDAVWPRVGAHCAPVDVGVRARR